VDSNKENDPNKLSKTDSDANQFKSNLSSVLDFFDKKPYFFIVLILLFSFSVYSALKGGIYINVLGIVIDGRTKCNQEILILEKEKNELEARLREVLIEGRVEGDEEVFPVNVYFVSKLETLNNPGEFFLKVPRSYKGKLLYVYSLGKSKKVVFDESVNLALVNERYKAKSLDFQCNTFPCPSPETSLVPRGPIGPLPAQWNSRHGTP
jgi:hypothetical protein